EFAIERDATAALERDVARGGQCQTLRVSTGQIRTVAVPALDHHLQPAFGRRTWGRRNNGTGGELGGIDRRRSHPKRLRNGIRARQGAGRHATVVRAIGGRRGGRQEGGGKRSDQR